MIKRKNSEEARRARHARVRKKVSGTTEIPRLCVYRSLKNIYAQIIDDTTGKTLVSASTLDAELKANYGGNKEAAKTVGMAVAKRHLMQTSRLLYLTEADMFTTAELLRLQQVLVKADWNSNPPTKI